MILKLVIWPPWPPLLSCNTFNQRSLFDHKGIFHNSMCPAFWPSILSAWYQRLNSSWPPINREKSHLLAGKFHGRLNFNYSNWNSNILKKARQTGRRMARCCIKHPYIYNTTQEIVFFTDTRPTKSLVTFSVHIYVMGNRYRLRLSWCGSDKTNGLQ